MKKLNVLKKIYDESIVAVIRASNAFEALEIARSCKKGGINIIEITFTIPFAHELINNISKELGDDITLGAGTVLDSETARIAIVNGAQFIVSPGFCTKTAMLCNRYQTPYIPGCISVTEILTAMDSGVDIVKYFPGSMINPSIIRDILGPLPHANIMVTGGVSLDNIKDWFKNGVMSLGVGSLLTKVENDNYKEVEIKAARFVEKIKEAKLELI